MRGKELRLCRVVRWLLPVALIAIYVGAVFAAHWMWPLKNVCEGYIFPHRLSSLGLTMDFLVNPGMRYNELGSSAYSHYSLLYTTVVILSHNLIPYRLLALRTVSVLSSVFTLIMVYSLSRKLFCRQIGLICLFILVTSSYFIELYSVFSMLPFSGLIAVAVVYTIVSTFNEKRVLAKVAAAAFLSYLTLGLYIASRLVIFLPIVFFGIYPRKNWKKLLLFIIVFLFIMLSLDAVLGGPGYRWKVGIVHEELLKAGKGDFIVDIIEVLDGVRENMRIALHYLSVQSNGWYSDANESYVVPPSILPIAYMPFLVAGLIFCLRHRRRGHILLLLWFLLMFFGPFLSHELKIRRITYAYPPMYILIALGMWGVFTLAKKVCSSQGKRLALSITGLLFLGVVGYKEVYAWLF